MRKNNSIWILLMAIGLVFLIIGVLAFTRPLSSYVRLAKYTGAGLLINGMLLQAIIVVNKRYPKERVWMQVESILDFLFALLLLSIHCCPLSFWIILSGYGYSWWGL